jgi:hypothetical protein
VFLCVCARAPALIVYIASVMSTDDWWNNIDRLMPKYSEKNLSDCHFLH